MDVLAVSKAFETSLSRRRPAKAGPLPWQALDPFRNDSRATNDDRPRFDGSWPSLTQLFRINVWRYPERPCLTVYEADQRVSYTYAESLAKARQYAAWLASQGIKPGDRVAICGKNSPQWALAFLATLFADAIAVPLDVSLRSAELAILLSASGSSLFFADADKLAAFAAESVALPASLSQTVCLEPGPNHIEDLSAPEPANFEAKRSGPEIAAILYTSGTTGNPKGVMLSHDNLVSDAFLSQYHLPLSAKDVFYALLPIHHSYTLQAVFIESLSVGSEIVFGKRMVVAQILKELKQAKVTMFLGVPLLFNRLLAGILKGIKEKGPMVWFIIRTMMRFSGLIKKTFGINPGKKMFGAILSKASLDSVRICISGGGPLPAETFRRFNQLGINFVQGYGLTETAPIVALNPTWRYKEQSVGALVPGVEARILDPDQEGHGEIALRGPMVMRGYYGQGSAGGLELEADGWLHTGDVGWIDKEGYLYLTGRAKNVIVTEGGKNVYPEEIEDNFQSYPEIEQVMVRGFVIDPETKAEGIEALIFPNTENFPEKPSSPDHPSVLARVQAIINEVNARLAGFKKIHRHQVLDKPMEMTSTKKIRRFTVGDKAQATSR